jgi:hypothetical protein
MANGKINLSNASGKSGIKMGEILTREELRSRLRSGRGIVIKERGANYFVVGDENSAVTDEGKDTLRKNLIGAGYNGEIAFMVINDQGTLRWEEGKKFSSGSKKQDLRRADARLYPSPDSRIRI